MSPRRPALLAAVSVSVACGTDVEIIGGLAVRDGRHALRVLALVSFLVIGGHGSASAQLPDGPSQPVSATFQAPGRALADRSDADLAAMQDGAWAEVGGGIGVLVSALALGAGALALGLESEIGCVSSPGWLGGCPRHLYDDGLLAASLVVGVVGIVAIVLAISTLIVPGHGRTRRIAEERWLRAHSPPVSLTVSPRGAVLTWAVRF